MKKNVKVVLGRPASALANAKMFEVKKTVNTLKVKVGEHIEEEKVESWLRDGRMDNWTIEFVR